MERCCEMQHELCANCCLRSIYKSVRSNLVDREEVVAKCNMQCFRWGKGKQEVFFVI